MNSDEIEKKQQELEYISSKNIFVANNYFIDGSITKSKKLISMTTDELVLELKNPRKKSFYEETFYNGKPLKLFFDIEWYTLEDDGNKDYLNYILKALDQEGIKYVVATASSFREEKDKFKHSYRIISTNMVFDSMLDMANYIKYHLRDIINSKYAEDHDDDETVSAFDAQLFRRKTDLILDTAVYVNGQRKIRLPLTYKMGKDGKPMLETYMKILNDAQCSDFFISTGYKIKEPLRFSELGLQSFRRVEIMIKEEKNPQTAELRLYKEEDINRVILKLKEVVGLLPTSCSATTSTWNRVLMCIAGVYIKCGKDGQNKKNEFIALAHEFSSKSNYSKSATDAKILYYMKGNKGFQVGLKTVIGIAKNAGVYVDTIDDMISTWNCSWFCLVTYLLSLVATKPDIKEVVLNLSKLMWISDIEDTISYKYNVVDLNGCIIGQNYKVVSKKEFNSLLGGKYILVDSEKPTPNEKKKNSVDAIVKTKKLKFDEIIIKYCKYLTVARIVFNPATSEQKPNIHNIWRGFVAKRLTTYDPKKIEGLLYHIKHRIAEDEQSYHNIIKWCAHLLQRPNVKTGVLLTIMGGQKVGKSSLLKFLSEKVIGSEYSIICNGLTSFLDSFNSITENKILIGIEEARQGSLTEFRSDFNRLKSLITESTNIINEKFLKRKVVTDYSNIMMISNHDSPLHMEKGLNRRFLTSQCQGEQVTPEYIKEVLSTFTSECADHFYTFCLQIKLEDIETFEVNNKSHNEMKIRALSCFDRWLYDNGTSLVGIELGISDLYTTFKHDLSSEDIERKINRKQFKIDIEKVLKPKTMHNKATYLFTKECLTNWIKNVLMINIIDEDIQIVPKCFKSEM